jgi:hypothetical protein
VRALALLRTVYSTSTDVSHSLHFTAARLDSTQRKLRSTIRSRNEKALAQLRGAGACLQRATVAVQNAKRTADAALEELASRLQVPPGLSSPKAGDAKTSAAL